MKGRCVNRCDKSPSGNTLCVLVDGKCPKFYELFACKNSYKFHKTEKKKHLSCVHTLLKQRTECKQCYCDVEDTFIFFRCYITQLTYTINRHFQIKILKEKEKREITEQFNYFFCVCDKIDERPSYQYN